jgi:hypothetical protein
MSKNILQEAIADAKMIRETALKNAKNALEETLKPKLEKMMSKKLNEMDEFGNDELEEDVDLSSILQELEDDLNEVEDDDDSDKSEKKDDDKKSAPKKDDKKDDKSPSKPSKPKEKEGSEKDEDDQKLSDLSVEEFTSLIQSVVSAEMNPEPEMGGDDLGMGDDSLGGGDEFGMGDDLDGGMGDLGGDEFGGEDLDGGMPGTEDEDEFNIDEILDELENMDKPATTPAPSLNENKKLKVKLIEAYKAVKVLRTEINEINLLNAKLLYVNKIFKAKNLNESQKLRVISSFDKATNVKEVKLIFESLSSNLLSPVNPNKKATIKENLGFASKPSGMSRKPILEVNESLSRMQVLAGIK